MNASALSRNLDQLGVPAPLRERAKMMWLITLLGGLWGWVVCAYVWKVEGQDQSEWYQFQLKQSFWVGVVSLVGMALCGIGWFVNAAFGLLGFMAIGKGDDFEAPGLGPWVRNSAPKLGFLEVSSTPAPAQATYGQPVQQPTYGQPGSQPSQQPTYGQPVQQPAYGQPAQQPAFGQPAQQPAYTPPAQQQAVFGQPSSQPAFGQPAQQPAYTPPQPVSMEPVEGVGLQHWAWGQGTINRGGSVDQVVGYLNIDAARWDRAAQEWNARMARDGSDTIAAELRKYMGQ